MKEHKKTLIITSVIILLPILAGLLLWNRLPDTVPTHWNFSGEADGWGTKAFAVFAPPVFMLLTHWFCAVVTFADPWNKGRNRKIKNLVLWTMPFVSLFSSAMLYGAALNAKLNITSITFSIVGLMFLVIGNYMPKTTHNYTIGIKVPWALANEENWRTTHRFGGRVWVAGGLALVLLAFLPMEIAIGWMVIILLVMGFAPMLYSWLYYKKQVAAGTVDASAAKSKEEKTNAALLKGTLIFTAVVFVMVGIFLCTGNIDYVYDEDSFTIEASFWNDLTVDYAEITDIEYREENVDGSRIWGLGSFRLLLGAFENEEFGNYTRYTYYKPEACVVVKCGEKTLVLSGADAAETRAICEELTARTEG